MWSNAWRSRLITLIANQTYLRRDARSQSVTSTVWFGGLNRPSITALNSKPTIFCQERVIRGWWKAKIGAWIYGNCCMTVIAHAALLHKFNRSRSAHTCCPQREYQSQPQSRTLSDRAVRLALLPPCGPFLLQAWQHTCNIAIAILAVKHRRNLSLLA